MRVWRRAATCAAAVMCTAACSGGPAAGDAPGAAATDAAVESAARTGRPDASEDSVAGARAPQAPAYREVTLPAGTTLAVALDTAAASDTSRVEDKVEAHLTQPVVVDGITAVAEGSRVSGVVTDATRAGKVKGTSRLALRFDALAPAGSDEVYAIATSTVARSGPSEKKSDAIKIAAPAAGGAIVGGIVGGKKGAVIGGAAGGGAGTAVVMSQRGEDVRLGRGATLTVRLTEPLTIRVKS